MADNKILNRKMNQRSLGKDIIVQSTTPETFKKREKLFIVGPPRSGTTLLNSLLSGDLFLPECSFVSNLFKMFDEIFKYSDEERFHYYVNNLNNLVKIFEKPIYDLLYTSSKIINTNSVDLLVYKDPMLTNYIQYFDLFFGDTYKIIFCVRDPRDTVASMFKVNQKQHQNSDNRALFTQSINFVFPFYKKIFDIDQELEVVNLKKLVFIRYEDIVSNEKTQISRLETFIKHKLDFSTENEIVSSRLDRTSPFYSENYGRSVTTKPIGKFRTILNRAQIKEIETQFTYYLDKFNY